MKYHSGPPPSIGWWPTVAFEAGLYGLRWFDGNCWSFEVPEHWEAKWAGVVATQKSNLPASDIYWAHRPADWPERSRT